MCGIFGIVYRSADRAVSHEVVRSATDVMAHRGPDDSGVFVSGNVGLGHRRLSIVDLSNGHQPMFNEDGTVSLVYNGEIYNHLEARSLLVSKGHTFKTRSDTEVIIHAYQEWGTKCLEHFNGMFAFLLWDSPKNTLWIVRDRLGVKPLYYTVTPEACLFASEIKALLKTQLVKSELNERVLDAYFTLGFVPGPETIFKNIYKLQPGHFMLLKDGELSQSLYWDFNRIEACHLSLEQAIGEVKDLLQDSVRIRLMSDVPLGVFLSGGLDSSLVTAMMNEAIPGQIKTFTVGYNGNRAVSEEPFAKIVAGKFRTSHRVFRLEPETFYATLQKLVYYGEEPLVESAGIALYHLSRMAKEEATVLLSGEGADEVFAGYHLYWLMSLLDKCQEMIPRFVWEISRLLAQFIRKPRYSKLADWVGSPLEERFQGTSASLTESGKMSWYSKDFRDSRGSYLNEVFTSHFRRVEHQTDALAKIQYVDIKTWLVDNLLTKADKMTMASGVELRVPFLDYRLVEKAWALPSWYKLKGRTGKYILKCLARNHLPEEIIGRQKVGFPVPTNHWFRGELVQEILPMITRFSQRGWFQERTINKLVQEHLKGIDDHSRFLLACLVLEEWISQYT